MLKLDHYLSSFMQEFPPASGLSINTKNCCIYKSMLVLLYIVHICVSLFKKFFGKY